MANGNSTSSVARLSGLQLAISHLQTVSLVIYCVIFVIGTVGNGLVIYVTGFRMKRTVNSVWFLNLALADFLFMTFLIFSIISLSQKHQWPFGRLMCKLNNFVNLVNMFASVFLLTAISLDRCFSVWVVVWAHNKRTVCKAQIISAVIWVVAGICSIPNVTFRTLMERNNMTFCVYPGTMTSGQKWSLISFRFVMGFLIPFLVILVSHVAIGVRASRMHRIKKKRSRRVIFSIIFAFFICWLPFHVFSFMELKVSDNPGLINILRIGSPLSLSLAYMNSCLNPILYVFMCNEFQKKLQQSVCLVLESALAEDNLSFASSRSLSSHFSRISRKSDSAPPLDVNDATPPLTFTAAITEGTKDKRNCSISEK
ncbi:C3a anaphylatoxin chemotactic receptor-like [Cololabis saira]|uniref:C3a anaphylatoxin chemotactic receptor-like n=1 Tax=Cololabis saira TaxID=129043 RepID=UPI002AD4EDD7|nr:C3a anaphylatoxin chemotactic receptor-like [Cololabis saira]